MEKRKYVVGLMFNDDKTLVAMIQKRHGPPCVIGKWNGIGGHVEEGEEPAQTMVREFEEETGVLHTEWEYLCSLDADDHVVYFYFAVCSEALHAVRTVTDERVTVQHAFSLPIPTMYNLTWMVPFICDPDVVPFLGQIQVLGTDQ